MKLKTLVPSIAIACLISTAAVAETKAVGSGPNPFSDCGIGASLFPNHPVGAVISNVIWDVGTTAITSATASPETCNGKNVKAAAFIMESYDQLLEETTKGSGDHIAALFNILEVSPSEHAAALASIRSKLSSEISSPSFSSLNKASKASAYYDSVISTLANA